MDKLNQILSNDKEKISKALESFLKKKQNESGNVPFYKDCAQKLEEFCDRGKMLRGTLALLTASKLGSTNENIEIGAALELIHSGLLIHDDVMDQDFLRRGQKTIFAQYADEAKTENIENSRFYGEGMAICCGDMAYFLAYELINKSNLSHQARSNITKIVSAEIQRVGAAQMADFHFGMTQDEPTLDEILNIYRYKSARYTFSLPLRVGAEIAAASDSIKTSLDMFGENLGIIFQIKDDEIGLLGDEDKIGKPVGSDVRQNKKTLIRTLLYQKSNDKTKLDSIFGKQDLSNQDIEYIKSQVYDLGVKDEVDSMLKKYAIQCEQLLENIDIDQEYKDILKELITYNLNRSV